MMSVRYSFVTVCESLGSIGWRIDVAGLTTPTFRLAAGEATIAWPIAAAGGLIAAQQWSNEAMKHEYWTTFVWTVSNHVSEVEKN